MIIAGLTPVAAQAVGSPYSLTEVKSGLDASADLVSANTRVYWKSGNQLWTSNGTTSLALHTFTSATSLSLTQASPQYTESGFFNYSTFIKRAVTVGDTIYFWAASDNPMNQGTDAWNIWKSDGTVNGTVRVTERYIDFFTPSGLDNPTNLKIAGNYIYYWDHFRDGFGTLTRNLNRLNLTSGANEIVTGAPTNKPCDNQSGSSDQNQFEIIGSKLIFDYGDNMAMSGQDCITRIGALDLNNFSFTTITPISVGPELFSVQGPHEWTRLGDKIYFIGSISDSGYFSNSELWVTDGTAQGTEQFTNLKEPGVGVTHGVGNTKTAFMKPFTFGGYLYFAGWQDSIDMYGIYRTTGTGSPELWMPGTTLTNLGARTNVPPQVISNGGVPYLIVDGFSADNKQHMFSINMTTKAATLVTPNASSTDDSVGTLTSPWGATDYTAPITWNGKVWWVAKTNADNPGNSRNVFYTDGTQSGTAAVTTFDGDLATGIGYQGPNQVDSFAENATRPLVATTDGLWFLRGPVWPGTTWSLYRVQVNNTPPAPALTCSNQMTKLKVEADSATDLSPAFSGNTCSYTMKVDNKTSKVDFTPTFTGSINVKVGGTSVTTSLKSTKTQTVNLGGAGTDTVVDFAFGSNTYRVTITRAAPAVPGGRDPGFTAPSLPNGSVKSTDKDTKKEVNQNGDKKETEVTYVGGSFDGKVAKLDDKGKKDEEFSSKVPTIGGSVEVVKVDEQHRVLVGGQNVDGDKDVVRLKPDGSKDNSFSGPDLGSGKKVNDIDVKDGKIVIGGDFGDGKNVKKLKDNGSEDESFKNNIEDIDGEVKVVKIQEDDKVLVGGHFENADGDNDKDKIVRLNKDGHIDGDFEPATNSSDPTKKAHFNDDVEDIDIQKDGKIVVVGKSEKTNDDEADKVVRLKKDGKEDETFVFDGNIPSGKKVEAVKVKDSGEVYIAGDFENVGDSDGDKVAKVKKDGHVDTDWNPPTQGGDVHDVELEKHGKVFLGGDGSGDGDKVDKVEEDGDRPGDKPRYDSIDDDQASNKVDTGTKGQTKIHGDGFKDGTTVTVGGQPATVVKIDDRDEEITVQIPTPDNNHKGGSDHERKGADIVIHVPDGNGGHDDIEVKDGFGYVDVKEAQQIKPDNDNHINSDKDDDDHKGKVNDDEALAAHIPSDDPVTHVSKTPGICTVDDENRVHYTHRGDCKIVTDAPGDMGHADPAPVTEIIPVAGLDPELVAPTLPDWVGDVAVPEVPDSGFQLPAPSLDDPSIPVVYTAVTPDACDVSPDGLVVPIDPGADCTVKFTTPGTSIYEPTAPSAPPVQVTIPAIAWIPPVVDQNNQEVDPAISGTLPVAGGKTKVGDMLFDYNKAKGTLTPTAYGIYFGPIKATINYSWSGTATGSASCVVSWGVLKKFASLKAADKKKYKSAMANKVFLAPKGCTVSAAAQAALAKPGVTFTAVASVLRDRRYPTNYSTRYPVNYRLSNQLIPKKLRHYTVTITVP